MTGRVTGVVLAAGLSRRLGQPKQLLAYRGATLLDATLGRARSMGFDQLIVTLGSAADQVRATVDLHGVDVVENPTPTDGSASSLAVALDRVDGTAVGMILLLGDQPDVAVSSVHALVAAGRHAPLAACRYRNGRGHPFWFGRDLFSELAELRRDKAVWHLMASGRHDVTEVPVDTDIPLDVDTMEDYEALLAADTSSDAER